MRSTLRLLLGRGTARAELVRRGRILWAGTAPFATPDELEEAVGQLAAAEDLPTRPAAIQVEVEPPLAQVRTLTGLPPVRTAGLRSLVATQAARYFRRNGKPLVTDACWRDRKARREGIAVAFAVEEPWLNAVIRGARVAGLEVETVSPAEQAKGIHLGVMPIGERRRQRTSALLSMRRLAVVAALFWLAAVAVYLFRVREETTRVDREIARLEPSTKALAAARRALGDAASAVEVLDRAESERKTVLAQIVALSAALPDSAYVTALAIGTDRRGSMSVVARRSAEVLAAVDRSSALLSPRIYGALVREEVGGLDWERFTVEFGAVAGR